MPVPPYTWQTDDFLTASRLNGELYRTGGQQFSPNGTGFHAAKPIYRSFGYTAGYPSGGTWGSLGGNVTADALDWPVLADTGSLFGHRMDPLQAGSVVLNVPNSGGAAGIAGGLGLVTMNTPFSTYSG